jgi:hypothetical protein
MFKIKQHDTLPDYVVTLLDSNGNPIDLSTVASVQFLMRPTGTQGTPTVNEAMEIVGDPTEGSCQYSWQGGDTDASGVYDVEYELTFNNGKVLTIPTDKYDALTVYDDIGDTP